MQGLEEDGTEAGAGHFLVVEGGMEVNEAQEGGWWKQTWLSSRPGLEDLHRVPSSPIGQAGVLLGVRGKYILRRPPACC